MWHEFEPYLWGILAVSLDKLSDKYFADNGIKSKNGWVYGVLSIGAVSGALSSAYAIKREGSNEFAAVHAMQVSGLKCVPGAMTVSNFWHNGTVVTLSATPQKIMAHDDDYLSVWGLVNRYNIPLAHADKKTGRDACQVLAARYSYKPS